MTTYARIVGGQAVDVTTGDPAEEYHADIAAQFQTAPDGTQCGDHFDGTAWSRPTAPAAAAAAALAPLTPMTFYLAFKPAERIAIKKSADPLVMEFWESYQLAVQLGKDVDPNLPSVAESVSYLAQGPNDTPPGPGILGSRDRIAQILAGLPQ